MSMNKRAWCLWSVSLGALGVASAAAAQTAPQSEPSQLDDVVVTASKRAELLRDVPQAVTAVGAAELGRQNIQRFEDLVGHVPGFVAETQQPGNTRLTLRGVNAGGSASTVAVYVDETPYGSNTGLANGGTLAADIDTFDLQRVEVLRGPQGTLYGASSLGGLVKFVTRQPELGTWGGALQTGAESIDGGDDAVSAKFALNVPLGDRVAVRGSGYYRQDAGFIDDPARNLQDVNDGETTGGRIAILARPSDTLTLRASAAFQDIANASTPEQDVDVVTLETLGGDLTQSREINPFSDVSYRVYSAGGDLDIGWATLSSITSYASFEQRRLQDFSQVVGAPAAIDGGVEHDRFTQEIRLASNGEGRLDWLVGAYYAKEDAELTQNLFLVDDATDETTGAALVVINLPSEYKETAVFGSATYDVTDRLSLTAGLRFSTNEQSAQQAFNGAPFAPVTETSDDVTTYSIAPRFELSENATIYARVATGYRPGGPNLVPPGTAVPLTYQSDTVTNYEIGIKGELADGRLSYDLAAFWIDWSDIQLLTVVNGNSTNANGGDATSKGFEFAAEFRPTEGLSLSLTGAYTDAMLDEDTGPPLNALDGDRLPFSPKWAGSISADYERPLTATLTGYVGATWRYTGERDTQFDAGIGQLGLESYDTLNLRAGLQFGRFDLQAFVHNVDDSRGITNVTGGGVVPGGVGVSIIRPRTFGLTLNASF